MRTAVAAAAPPVPAPARPASRLLRRKCACGGAPGLTGECAECQGRRRLQRRSSGDRGPDEAPPIVHEVLRSPGRPLDPATRALFEPRLGRDLGGVRVHTDGAAAASASAVGALAWTVGRDVAFASGRYEPATEAGRRLLAHELAHVAQGRGRDDGRGPVLVGPASDRAEAEAERFAAGAGGVGPVATSGVVLRRQERRPSPPRVDERAQAIIDLAQDSNRDLGRRAVEVVWAIIRAYHPDKASLVSKVVFEDGEQGLGITYRDDAGGGGGSSTGRTALGAVLGGLGGAGVGASIGALFGGPLGALIGGGVGLLAGAIAGGLIGAGTGRGGGRDGGTAGKTGVITVGRYFVENTTAEHFARRVAQVGHEIEHVEQQRAGMGGEARQDEREFRAFHHEALFTVPAGAGRMQHRTRVKLIDGALGYYHCLTPELQQRFEPQRQELLARRTTEDATTGHNPTSPPTSCRRQGD
jgi:hypothetical protein